MTGKLMMSGGLGALALLSALGAPWAGGPAAGTAARSHPAQLTSVLSVCAPGAPSLTVQGTGTVTAVPDLLNISLGVETTAATANAALAANDTKSQAMVATLVASGVAKPQIQTSGLSVQPNYNNSGRITSYVVDNYVSANLLDIAKAGSVVDAVAAVVGNAVRVNGLNFGFQHPSALVGQAEAAAVRQAQAQAAAMAAAAKLTLKQICSIHEDSNSTPTPQPLPGMAATARPSTPIEAGTQQVTASVTVTYLLGATPTSAP